MSPSTADSADLASFANPPSVETALEDGERLAKFIDANIPPSSRGRETGPINRLEVVLARLRASPQGSLEFGLHAGTIIHA
jgi:hypothetical protein